VYLVDKHSLQTVPGALLLSASADLENQGALYRGEFLGIGDPVYNQADPRWHGGISWSPAAGQLQRLVGSRDEIEWSAESWVKGGGHGNASRGVPMQRRGGFFCADWRGSLP